MDLYVVLGLPHGATESEIKRAYRRLARRFHPDINPGDRAAEARFRQIAEAYETLTDPDRRSSYDSGGSPDSSSQRRPSGFEGFDFSASADQSVTFGDLFAEVLIDRAAQRPRNERGADLHHDIAVVVRGSARRRHPVGDGDTSGDVPHVLRRRSDACESGSVSSV